VDLEPIFCGFASTAEELERISDFIAGAAWDGDLGGSREKRLCVCNMMEVDMQMRAPSDIGKNEYVCEFFFCERERLRERERDSTFHI
jgi:hypothetical protein